MKFLFGLVAFRLIYTSLAFAEPVDWFEIADNTDAPAIGGTIVTVKADSSAEGQNFQVGDLISRLNNGYYGFDKEIPDDPYEVQIYSPKNGTNRTVKFPGGYMGINIRFFNRPWISYLREEIGIRGTWDEELVELMVELFGSGTGRASMEQWQGIVDSGYPEDDALYDLIELAFALQNGQTIQPYYFFTRWESELSPMPDTVFHILERMALVINDRRLLKALSDINIDNMRVSRSDLRTLLSKGKGVQSKNGGDLFDYVQSIKGQRLEKNMRDVGSRNHKQLVNRKSVSVENGRYLSYWFSGQKSHKSKEFHFQIKFRAVGKPISSRYAATIRIGAYRYDNQAKESKAKFGTISIIQAKDGSRVECLGNDISYVMKFNDEQSIPTNIIGKPVNDIKDSPLITMDLIYLKDQCAVYLNGKAMGHWPITDSAYDSCLSFYTTGCEVRFQDFAIWGLKSS